MFGVVYKITAPNGKSYIGQNITSVHAGLKAKSDRVSLSLRIYGLKDRVKQHRSKNSNCILLKRSIAKYGWENMKLEILLRCSIEHLDFYEKQMIKAWDTLAPNGLNCTTGGEAGKKLSVQTREKVSEGLRRHYEHNTHAQKGKPGRPPSNETREKIRDRLTGSKHPKSDKQKMKLKIQANGYVGLHKETGKYQAIIPKSWTQNGKKKGLGLYQTEEEAWCAIAEYKAEYVCPDE